MVGRHLTPHQAGRPGTPYGWRDLHQCLTDSTTESAVGRESIGRPRHIFVSGAADGRRYRCTMGSRTKTTAPRANRDASKGEALEIMSARIASPSARSNGVSSAFRTNDGIDVENGADPLGDGGAVFLGRDFGSGKGRTLSLLRRISSTSKSSRDLRGAPSSCSSRGSAWSLMGSPIDSGNRREREWQ